MPWNATVCTRATIPPPAQPWEELRERFGKTPAATRRRIDTDRCNKLPKFPERAAPPHLLSRQAPTRPGDCCAAAMIGSAAGRRLRSLSKRKGEASMARSVTRALRAIERYRARPDQIDHAILAAINV